VEIDVARGVDEIEHVVLATVLIMDGDRGCFDGDAAFAFYIHPVENLLAHIAFTDRTGAL
jgi:hypothetical protein